MCGGYNVVLDMFKIRSGDVLLDAITFWSWNNSTVYPLNENYPYLRIVSITQFSNKDETNLDYESVSFEAVRIDACGRVQAPDMPHFEHRVLRQSAEFTYVCKESQLGWWV